MPTSTLLLCLTRDPVKHINSSIVPPKNELKNGSVLHLRAKMYYTDLMIRA